MKYDRCMNIAMIVVLVLGVGGLLGMLYQTLARETRCEDRGGLLIAGHCIDKAAEIEL